MAASERVDYQACPRDARHVRLGHEPCGICGQPSLTDRALTRAGKLHWLVWQQHLAWADRYRPQHVLDLTGDDFGRWAVADPAGHRAYVDFLVGCAAFGPDDVRRSTRGYLFTPGEPPITLILQPDGSIARPEHAGAARWAVDPAGLLVLSLDRTQVRVIGRRSGLHVGRQVTGGATRALPVFVGLWSDDATTTGVRLTAHSATALLGPPRNVTERDLFRGDGERMSVLGPERPVRVETEVARRRVTYRVGPRRIGLDGGPVYRGAGDYADWRLVFLRPMA